MVPGRGSTKIRSAKLNHRFPLQRENGTSRHLRVGSFCCRSEGALACEETCQRVGCIHSEKCMGRAQAGWVFSFPMT